MQARRALKALLWFIAVYQFLVGALLISSPALAQIVVRWYGASVDWTDQFSFILRPLGAYMVMTGLIAAGAARAEVPHPSIVVALSVLFFLNALYRILLFSWVAATFAIATWHLTGQILVLLALGVALWLLSRVTRRTAMAGAAA